MKLHKLNGITHINNRLAGTLIQGALPDQCLTAGAATLIRNVFSQTLPRNYVYFLKYYAKNVTQSLRRHYATLRRHYAYFLIYYAKHVTQSLRRHYATIITHKKIIA